MRIERISGAILILLSGVLLLMAAYGGTPEDRDATAILLTLPMGLVALFTEIPERGKRTKRDYDGTLEDVFTGFVSGDYDGGTYANEVALKDEMLLMEETIINDTFLDTTPQELISYFLAQAGLSKMKLSSKTYPTRKMLPIRRQTAVQAINAVNAAWGLRVPFFFSGGVFYWDEKPEQKKVYTFERGVNILNLRRAGGVWELETVSAPFIKHSHKINLIHPQVSGEVEVSKVVSKTNDSGFIRTYIYF